MAGSAIAPAMVPAATAKGEGILPDGAIRRLIAAGHIDLA
jgi:hypothetical protein